jgi:hypothetical protein
MKAVLSGYLAQLLSPLFMPRERKIDMAGHQPVKADCNKFNPTNAVSQNQLGETK